MWEKLALKWGCPKDDSFNSQRSVRSSSLLTQIYGKSRAEITEFSKFSRHAQGFIPMGKLYHGDKVSPHEAKPSLLPLETEKFLIAREPSGNLIFAELCRRVRAPLALPTSLSTFCLRRVSQS